MAECCCDPPDNEFQWRVGNCSECDYTYSLTVLSPDYTGEPWAGGGTPLQESVVCTQTTSCFWRYNGGTYGSTWSIQWADVQKVGSSWRTRIVYGIYTDLGSGSQYYCSWGVYDATVLNSTCKQDYSRTFGYRYSTLSTPCDTFTSNITVPPATITVS